MNIAIIGAGWAGMAAAVEVSLAGHNATVFEGTRSIGGRARGLSAQLPDGIPVRLDNGQHILIGAYTEALRLMRLVGVHPGTALLSQPMRLVFPDGMGLRFPAWPTPLDALAGIVGARGWRLHDKWSLLRVATGWQLNGFHCDDRLSVASLCTGLSPRVMAELIEPLCVSALNTPADRASAKVFLRVLKDALFGVQGGSRLLLPRVDLGALFPVAAAQWLAPRGSSVRLGERVTSLLRQGRRWQVQGEVFDAVILASSALDAVRLLDQAAGPASALVADGMGQWAERARALQFEAITTVYAWAEGARLPEPMLTLRAQAAKAGQLPAPAQFVFDRGQLGGPAGLLAFVVSASEGTRDELQAQVLKQTRRQLGLQLQAVQTVVEKRATFACTPGLTRPALQIAPGLWACGDYVDGPYPATLEGAVRSALSSVAGVLQDTENQRHLPT
jgi:squalene-associated FAD-dependent desaturase